MNCASPYIFLLYILVEIFMTAGVRMGVWGVVLLMEHTLRSLQVYVIYTYPPNFV